MVAGGGGLLSEARDERGNEVLAHVASPDDSAPEARTIRALHATSLKASRDKLHLYLTTWTGGPPVYTDRYGHPRLRMRHFPFRIGVRERDEWLWCMDRALNEHDMPGEMREYLRERLHSLADHMRNQEG